MSESKQGEARLYALLTLMVLFWAGNFVVGKIALREFPPLMIAGLRTLFAGAFIWPVYWIQSRREQPEQRWTRSEAPALIGAGILGVVLNQFLFVIGLSMTSVAHASIIIGMGPIFVLLIAAAVGQESITGRKVVGLGMAIAGVGLLQYGRGTAHGPTLLGDLFVFLAGLTFATYTVIGKRMSRRHGTVTINTFAYVAGAVSLLPLTLWESSRISLSTVTPAAWLSVAYMGLFPSVVSYLIYSHALKHLTASRVSTFSYLQPLLAIVMAGLFLHEIPGSGFLGGGALVLGGVYVTERG